MKCKVCKKETERKSPSQLYCPDCSAIKDNERKLKYWRSEKGQARAKKWQQDYTKNKEGKKARSRCIEKGRKINKKTRNKIYDWMIRDVDIIKLLRLSYPFDSNFSKNAIWGLGKRGGHVYIRKEVNALKEQIAWDIKNSEMEWVHDKVWLDIYVQKPNPRFDAVNVIDTICDAVKIGMDIDDKWFSIRRLDWQVIKEDPRIYIGIGQEGDVEKQICSYCGRILKEDYFGKNRSLKRGIGRECKDCRKYRAMNKKK